MGRAVATLLFTLQVLVSPHFSYQRSSPSSPTYTAAVVEFAPPQGITMDNRREYFQRNVETYGQFVKKAKDMDADIIVFPECGLMSLGLPRHSDGSPALAFPVPAPSDEVNPCLGDSEDTYQGLRNLSCIARENAIYMVVNLPEKASSDSRDIFYNTNVVFDRRGTVIAKYRKFHLFGERGFTSPAQPDITIFETDFGVQFGTFICFDLMFEEPGMSLVRQMGVQDIVFPTAWFSELPFLTAVQAQEGWSHAQDVNFLGSGYNYPQVGSGGSGIYAGKHGAIVSSMSDAHGSFLLVASVPKKTSTNQVNKGIFIPTKEMKTSSYPKKMTSIDHVHKGVIIPLKDLDAGFNKMETSAVSHISKDVIVPPEDLWTGFNKKKTSAVKRHIMGNDLLLTETSARVEEERTGFFLKKEILEHYRDVPLTAAAVNSSDFSLGSGDFVCHFRVTMDPSLSRNAPVYHMVAYDGIRTFSGVANGGVQVCGVILCTNENITSCAIPLDNTDLRMPKLKSLEISGNFQRQHSLPMPSTLKDHGLMPLSAREYTFESREEGDKFEVTMRATEDNISFLTFGIYGRNFAEDS